MQIHIKMASYALVSSEPFDPVAAAPQEDTSASSPHSFDGQSSDNISSPSAEQIENLTIQSESAEKVLFPPPGKNKAQNPLLWSALCVLAIGIGAIQWFLFNMDTYAGSANWRPWYQSVCHYMGCKLPDYRNLDFLKTERLTVRSHSQYRNALVVDLLIINQSPFSQPVPSLEMAFYDINGQVLSQRAFQPEEYLPESAKSLEKIPFSTTVHITFSIIDPGSGAVNYELELKEAI